MSTDLSPETYDKLLAHSADVLTVIDTRGIIQYESAAITPMLGYEPTDIVGEIVFDYIHPEDRDIAVSEFNHLNNGTLDTDHVTVDLRFKRADGTWAWVESRASTHPASDDGEYVIASRDITEKKRRQQDLDRLRDLLEKTERIANVAGWEIDTDTREVFWTDHLFTLLQWDGTEEPPLEEALDVYHEDDQDIVERAVETALEDGESFDVEARFRRSDGEPRWFQITGVPTLQDGEVVALRGAVRDITAHKERQWELERQTDRLEEFVSMVSHDLRNPLTVAEGHLELARKDVENEHLGQVANALGRMRELIEELLEMARVSDGTRTIERVELAALVSDCWNTVDTAAATLVTETELIVQADRSQLRQLVENLMRNAVEHGGDHVTVTVGDVDTGFYIEDDGSGLPNNPSDRVFESGYTTQEHGTGYGLAIVRNVVQEHGWTITATESPTGGARFEITGIDYTVD